MILQLLWACQAWFSKTWRSLLEFCIWNQLSKEALSSLLLGYHTVITSSFLLSNSPLEFTLQIKPLVSLHHLLLAQLFTKIPYLWKWWNLSYVDGFWHTDFDAWFVSINASFLGWQWERSSFFSCPASMNNNSSAFFITSAMMWSLLVAKPEKLLILHSCFPTQKMINVSLHLQPSQQ